MSKAIIAAVTAVMEIPGAEKIQVAVVLGENVIVSKDIQVGYVGVFFPVDTQLSEEYCRVNNLFRDVTKNSNPEKAGFFDTNRRVRAQPFMKVKSQGYFAGLESLEYTLGGTGCVFHDIDLVVGVSFDEINQAKICNKYVSQATRDAIDRAAKSGIKKVKQNVALFFEKHQDSSQFKHNAHLIPKGALLSFHSKKHGTSHRQAYTKLSIQLPKWKEFVNKIKPEFFPTWKWGYVIGTRNVILSDSGKEGFHGSEQFRFDVAEQIKPYLEKGMQCFGEIVGYVNGKPIMPTHEIKSLKDKAYTKKYGDKVTYAYGCAEHEFKFHVYRLTYLTEEGKNVDFTQKQLEQWCAERNLPCTLEIAPQEIYDGDLQKLMEKVEALTERPEVLTEDYEDPTHITEGIIIRVDTGKHQPYFLKSKSYAFRVCEGLCESLDTEDAA